MSKRSDPHSFGASCFIALQYCLPQHLLSRLVFLITRWRWGAWKNFLINLFLRHFAVEMREAEQENPLAYPSFNAFFTRALKAGQRPLSQDIRDVVCPADGMVSEAGPIAGSRLIQAKGHDYTLEDLLGGLPAERFRNGSFATIYLAPHNYHRVHMPLTGRLVATQYVPGRLFSVNATTAARVPRVFARNERVVCLFEGPAGRFAVILVGALFVGSMSTVWAGDITPASRRRVTALPLPPTPLNLAKGAEMGRFNMGSTVILLFEPGALQWAEGLIAGKPVRMGETVGTLKP